MNDALLLCAVLAKNIRVARKNKGLTQAKLAELTDLSVTFINEIERGASWLSADSFVRVSRVLNIEAYQLLIPSPEEFSNSPEAEYSSIEDKLETENLHIVKKLNQAKAKLEEQINNEINKVIFDLCQKEKK